MRRNLRYAYTGLVILIVAVAFAILAPHIMQYDPNFEDSHGGVLDPLPPFPPSAIHPLGTDIYARDMLTRIAYGARYTLLLAVGVALLRLLLGLLGGFAVAYGPRFFGRALNWLYVLGSGLPPLIIYFVLFQRVPSMQYGLHGPSLLTLTIFLFALLESPRVMVAVRGRVEQLMHEPFYEGAVAVGGTRLGAFRRHLLPNLWTTLSALAASEAARTLLVIGALGLLGVQVMGTRTYPDPFSMDVNKVNLASLYPEWSSLLADNVQVVRQNPLVPLLPATALMLLVLGFGLLARGAEPLYLTLRRRWRQALEWLDHHRFTAGRRTALVLVLLMLGVLWHYQGLPWGAAMQIQNLVYEEQLAMAHRDAAALAERIDPQTPTYAAEQQHFVEAVSLQGMPAIDLRDLQVKGAEAIATLTLYLPVEDGKQKKVERHARFVRRWGTWYDAGYDGYRFHSLHGSVLSSFPLVDRSPGDMRARTQMLQAVGVLDKVVMHMQQAFPGLVPDGPIPVTLFPTHQAFVDSLGTVPKDAADLKLWWAPGESLRLSPSFLRSQNYPLLAADFDEQFSKLLAFSHGDRVTPSLLVGLGTSTDKIAGFRVHYADNWAGQRLRRLPDLLGMPAAAFTKPDSRVATMQVLQLIEWLKSRGVTGAQLMAATLQPPEQAMQALASDLHMTTDDLSTAYTAQLFEYLRGLSLLDNPNFQKRFPPRLLQEAALGDAAASNHLHLISHGSRLLKIDPSDPKSEHPTWYNVFSLVRYEGDGLFYEGVERWAFVPQADGTYKLDAKQSLFLIP